MNKNHRTKATTITTGFFLILFFSIPALLQGVLLFPFSDPVSSGPGEIRKLHLTTGLFIRKEVILPTPVERVWQAWTTEKGVTGFFAPEATVELAINGKYEMYFDPGQPRGRQGSEGCRILSFVPEEMLSFTWNAPTSLPDVRGERTWVVMTFERLDRGETRLSLVHLGWQAGPQWEKALQYFDRAWEIVLGRLHHYLQTGPLNWKSPYTPPVKKPVK